MRQPNDEGKQKDDVLQREFARLDVPQGFSEGVMQRIAKRERDRRTRSQTWRLGIAASLLICLTAGGYREYERREAERARAQFAVAMRVTSRSLLAVDRGFARGLVGSVKANQPAN